MAITADESLKGKLMEKFKLRMDNLYDQKFCGYLKGFCGLLRGNTEDDMKKKYDFSFNTDMGVVRVGSLIGIPRPTKKTGTVKSESVSLWNDVHSIP